MRSEDLVYEMVKEAAKEAEISIEQSTKCVKAAFCYAQKKTFELGQIDLSAIGIHVEARATDPLASKNKTH